TAAERHHDRAGQRGTRGVGAPDVDHDFTRVDDAAQAAHVDFGKRGAGPGALAVLVHALHLAEVHGRIGLAGEHRVDERLFLALAQPPVRQPFVAERRHRYTAEALAACRAAAVTRPDHQVI